MNMLRLLTFVTSALGSASPVLWPNPPSPLPRLSIDPAQVSISGLSSGADFSAQFQTAFSASIMGSGVFSGQPWHCATTRFAGDPLVPVTAANPSVPLCEGCGPNETLLHDHCKRGSLFGAVKVDQLVAAARSYAGRGLIDDPDRHLPRARVFTYQGTLDGNYTKHTHGFFSAFGAQCLANFSVPSGHCWPQDRGVVPCGGQTFWPLRIWPAENCGMDGPGQLLEHIYGPGLAAPADAIDGDHLHHFDQLPFDPKERPFLSQAGLLYVPASCAGAATAATVVNGTRGDGPPRCRLHVVVHGGGTPFWVVETLANDGRALGMSYNRWAETNRIVVLWPHAGPYGGDNATNDEHVGNWDTYGHTGLAYDTKFGIQMRALADMIETLSGVQM